jgi:hypothetical protein
LVFAIPQDLPRELYPLSYLVGAWRGEGTIAYPGIEQTRVVQHVRFAVTEQAPHAALTYDCLTYLASDAEAGPGDAGSAPAGDGDDSRPAGDGGHGQLWHQESGYWRLTPGQAQADPPFELEAMVVEPSGVMSLYLGQVDGPRVDMATDAVVRSASAPAVAAGRRMYGLVAGDLLWAWDMAAFGHPLGSYMAVTLRRADP